MSALLFLLRHLKANFFFYLFLACVCVIFVQHSQVEKLGAQIKLKDNQLAAIEKQAVDYTIRLNKLQEKVKEEQQVSYLNSQRILGSTVSNDCNQSLSWARDQSGYLK